MKKLLITLLVLILLIPALAGCQIAGKPSDPRQITLNLTYIPNVQFAPFYVAIEKGYFAEKGLSVNLNYGNEADMMALVGAGDQNLMIASGEQVLLSRAQGLPVVYVMAWYQAYPVGVVSLMEKNIQKPQDLSGRTVGIPGLFGASYIGFEALLRSASLQDGDVDLRSIGFSQVEAVSTNQVEAAVIYVANEPNVLESLGYPVNVIRVADYLDLVGNGLVTNEKTLQEDPQLVRDVIEALTKSIKDIQADPSEAYEICKLYVENLENADEQVQKAVLEDSIALWQIDNPGYSDQQNWQNMQELLLAMQLMKTEVDLNEVFTNDYLP